LSDSLKKRYAYKLGSKLLSLLLGLVTVGIVPKALGPSGYGTFSFLTFFFARIIKFMKLGTASAFFTKLSARRKESTLIGFYGVFLALISIVVMAFIPISIFLGANEILWPDQLHLYVYTAAGFSLLSMFSKVIHDTNDALGLTVRNEFVFITQNIFLTGMILYYFMTDRLDLNRYFVIHYSMQLYLIVFGAMVIVVYGRYRVREMFSLTRRHVRTYSHEFMSYSHPLMVNSIFILAVAIGDRWLLQKYAGSTEQGYYSLALKLVSICFLFTTSMVPLFTREIATSHEKNDLKKIRRLFNRNIPLFYFIAAYFSMFIALNSKQIVGIIGGEHYLLAAPVIAIMAFYPMHQTYGQMSGAAFLATGRTRTFRNIGVTTGVMGLIISTFLMAPLGGMGVQLGAVGLAVKMVLIQLVAVNIQLWINCKYLDLSFAKYFMHQLFVPVILIMVAYLSLSIVMRFELNSIGEFIVNGVIYTGLTFSILLVLPRLIVMSRAEILSYLNILKWKTN
jgi:O-antigen/teichoic acid export membrane protein